MRPDYCPIANEPCQRICDVPCSAHRLKPADDSDMAVYKAIAENYTAPQTQQPIGWLRAVDEEMVSTHLGVADITDSYENAKRKLNALICWHVDVSHDPKVNGSAQQPATVQEPVIDYERRHAFKAAVDFLMDCPLDHKDIRRAAAIASIVKEMEWPWWLEEKK